MLYLYYVSCMALSECVPASVWFLNILCLVCFGVLCICIDVDMHELYIPDLRRVGVT